VAADDVSFSHPELHVDGKVLSKFAEHPPLAVLSEEVAVGAARGIWKMLFAIGVAAEARLASGGGGRRVPEWQRSQAWCLGCA